MKNEQVVVIENQTVKLVFIDVKLDLGSIKQILISAYVRNATKASDSQKVP